MIPLSRLRLILAVLALAIIALWAALTFFPDRNLQLEAEIARMAPEAALARLDAELSVGRPQDAYLAFHQAELAAMIGRDAQAVAILDRLAMVAAPSAELADARAALALRLGQPASAAIFLAQAQQLGPSAARRQSLGYLYLQLRQVAAERSLLAATDTADLTPFERFRLVDLLIANRDPAAAATRLDSIIALDRAAAPDAVMRLTLALLDQPGRLEAAARLWLDRPDAADLIAVMARTLAGAGIAADPLARNLAAAVPRARVVLVTALTDGGQMAAARAIQTDWIAERRSLQAAEWAASSHYAERSGDLSVLQIALLSDTGRTAPGTALLPILRYQGAEALLPYRSHMTPDLLAATPLVAAGWAGFRQSPEQAYVALLAAAQAVVLPQDRALWRNIAASLAQRGVEARLRAAQAGNPALEAMFKDPGL